MPTTPATQTPLTSLAAIAQVAEHIYDERFRAEYEKTHNHEFVVIDVTDGVAYLGPNPDDALAKAEKAAPKGVFHLIKIGAPAAFKLGFIGERYADMEGTV